MQKIFRLILPTLAIVLAYSGCAKVDLDLVPKDVITVINIELISKDAPYKPEPISNVRFMISTVQFKGYSAQYPNIIVRDYISTDANGKCTITYSSNDLNMSDEFSFNVSGDPWQPQWHPEYSYIQCRLEDYYCWGVKPGETKTVKFRVW